MKTIPIYNRHKGIREMHTLKHVEPHQLESAAGWRGVSVDALGIVASVICLVHCLVLPVVIVFAPALGAEGLHEDSTHYFLAAFVTMFCLLGIVPGYLRHSNRKVLLTMISGLSLVLFATFACHSLLGELWEIPLITVGNLLVVSAHISNRKLVACC